MDHPQKRSASSKRGSETEKQYAGWGPKIKIYGIEVPLVEVALLLIGAVVGRAGAYFMSIKPDILGPLVEIGVQTACGEKISEVTTEPSPEIVVTAWAAEVVGKLLNIDGCVRIRDEESDIDYVLV